MIESRPRREQVDGVLLLDKPLGLSSNDALMRARRLLGALKAGHGGTLDPMASGLLPLAFGEATKFSGHSLDADKAYLADLVFGVRTDTADVEGEVIARSAVDLDTPRLLAALERFVGEIEQVPPMHSALKRDGKPLYAYAREGVEVERAARRVRIASIELVALEAVPGTELGAAGSLRARIRVACSKGTYVRTLAEDIGAAVGCGAHLGGLRRERVGALRVAHATTLDALEALDLDARRALLAPVDFLLGDLPRLALTEPLAARLLQGQRVRIDYPDTELARVYCAERLLGTASCHDGVLAPRRLVATQGETANAETANAETANAETANAETANAETANAETANGETRRRPAQGTPRNTMDITTRT